jgi:hypothetical protein
MPNSSKSYISYLLFVFMSVIFIDCCIYQECDIFTIESISGHGHKPGSPSDTTYLIVEIKDAYSRQRSVRHIDYGYLDPTTVGTSKRYVNLSKVVMFWMSLISLIGMISYFGYCKYKSV